MSGLRALIQRCTGGLVGGSSETPQFLILGLDKAGKTTLLYRLKIGQSWERIKEDMDKMRKPDIEGKTEDPGYHYEDLTFPRQFSAGIWEVPGTEPMRRVWSSFYHAIKIHGVIFVVAEWDTDEERIELAKKHLHFLMNEDELRHAAFCVIFNQQASTKGVKGTPDPKDSAHNRELYYRLGLHMLHPTCKWRTKHFALNVLELKGESDKNWLEVMNFMRITLMDSRGYEMKF
mmetsp:Transcript_34302/g.69348  ORF Transcript_34302/g.69348 Transcript_34302/m.69348 type:complete len:232 (-) Transcript_34302:90-785(-)|eukprot:CAMPEP_0113819736 /NCGR_PEP_ID=MMETSP0328-20130328/888_1 /TAXON_ID=39455 /ORGANISM="Alexandrium minutum" /LENGTH=231 /DNA_ID=CAMNT_0000787669 /DNA_START=102 /DNA_END=797 /DNA_ORIENTATION=+ /assembly_acc=CAM_ASM_000350